MGAISQPTERKSANQAGFRSGSSISFVAEPVTSINLLGFQNQAIHNPSLVDCANAVGTSSICTIISSVICEWVIRTFGSGYQNFRVCVPEESVLCINLIQPGRLRAFHLCCSLLGNYKRLQVPSNAFETAPEKSVLGRFRTSING